MLPLEIRADFELPCWPYVEGPGGKIPHEFLDYLKQYTVFRYLDDFIDDRGNYSDAILIPDENGIWPNDWESPIDCYQHMLYIYPDTLTIAEWPSDVSSGRELHRKIVAVTGDNYAWAEFNKSVSLHRIFSSHLVYISGHNTPGNITTAKPIVKL